MIDFYARQLAEKQSALADAVVACEKTGDTAISLQARIDAKQAQLDGIQAQRMAGNESDSDPAIIAALRLDIEGLQPLAAQAQAQHAAAKLAVEAAQQALQHADSEWVRVTAANDARSLETKLRDLEAVFCAGLRQLHTLKCQAESRPAISGTSLFRFGDQLDRFIRFGVTPA
jgi:hypothetical protein